MCVLATPVGSAADGLLWGSAHDGHAEPAAARSANTVETGTLRFRAPSLSDAPSSRGRELDSNGLAWGESTASLEGQPAPAGAVVVAHESTAPAVSTPEVSIPEFAVDEEPLAFADRLIKLASETAEAEPEITLLAVNQIESTGSEGDRLTQLLQYREDEANPFEKLDEVAEPLPQSDPDEAAAAIDEEIQRRAREPREDLGERFEEPADDFLNELLTDDPDESFETPRGFDEGDEEFKIEGGMPLPEAMQFGGDEERRRQFMQREREEAERNCEEEYEKIVGDRIDSISLDITVEGDAGVDYPFECGLGSELYEPRQWPQITYTWKAANLCHKPLYFEQVALERYGHTFGFYAQPLLSGVHFFGTLPILPYKMGLKTPNECVYTLGHYRPGNCAPRLYGGMPFTWRAALFQTGVVTGTVFTIP
ncbi:MAG: hypothetical protein AAGA92_07260 [Planctomycetota bacterium]